MESPVDLVSFVTRAENRVDVLLALASGPRTRPALQDETGIPRSTVSRILGEFEDRNLVLRADHRYEVTPFGGFLAERLHSIFNAIETMQCLQLLLRQLSDTDSDITFTNHTSSEILMPISSDPGAPARRFADHLQAASHVRLLVPSAIPALFDVDSAIGDGTQRFEVVIPRVALEVERDNSISAQRLRGVMASRDVMLFSYDGDIAHFAGTIDETTVVGLTDDAGDIQGYIETNDESVRSWTEAIVEAYQQHADRVSL